MSKESAKQFLQDAVKSMALREKFTDVRTPKEFLDTAQTLGYSFTTEELETIVKEASQGVETRRPTGIWPWLRTVPWI
jgi:predicted ribosomally synthesized peptide with nif11-like leader